MDNYTEGVAVMLFYQIGELFQSYAVGKSRRNISELMDIRPDYANIEKDGELEQVDPDEVEVGTIIVVQPGEKVPIDGVIEEGSSTLNTSALTGESVPREAAAGEEVISGCINLTGLAEDSVQQKNSENLQYPRFWIWWRIQALRSQDQRILFQNLPDIIHRQSATVRLHWPSCRHWYGCL